MSSRRQSIQKLMKLGQQKVAEGNGYIKMAKSLCPHVESQIVHEPVPNSNVTMVINVCVDCGVKIDNSNCT